MEDYDDKLDKIPADEWLAPLREPSPVADMLEHEYRQRRFMLPIRDFTSWISRATKRTSPPKEIGE
jgi:hypothetical protein